MNAVRMLAQWDSVEWNEVNAEPRVETMREPLHLHGIAVRYIGATNFKGSRVRMRSMRFGTSRTISYDHAFNNSADIAADWLRRNGMTVVAHANNEIPGCGGDDVLLIEEFTRTPFNRS